MSSKICESDYRKNSGRLEKSFDPGQRANRFSTSLGTTQNIFRVPGRNGTHDLRNAIRSPIVPSSVAKQPSFTSFAHRCIQRHSIFRMSNIFAGKTSNELSFKMQQR